MKKLDAVGTGGCKASIEATFGGVPVASMVPMTTVEKMAIECLNLRQVLRRTLHNFEMALEGKPIRDADETISEARKALVLTPTAISCSDATAVVAARKSEKEGLR